MHPEHNDRDWLLKAFNALGEAHPTAAGLFDQRFNPLWEVTPAPPTPSASPSTAPSHASSAPTSPPTNRKKNVNAAAVSPSSSPPTSASTSTST